MAAMENLASGALCGVLYHLFSGQPLTIIGSTGPVLVFETIVYAIFFLVLLYKKSIKKIDFSLNFSCFKFKKN
jgi:hypothetical protein